ncbi:MAG: hypothetical protein HYX38_20915 [Rhodospirillales bacterium]|nr:hypothetical protein [Rhodospirillales bacterium]
MLRRAVVAEQGIGGSSLHPTSRTVGACPHRYVTLYRLDRAQENRDAGLFAELIDWRAVREPGGTLAWRSRAMRLFPHLTAARNVAFPLEMRGVARADIDRRVARADAGPAGPTGPSAA